MFIYSFFNRFLHFSKISLLIHLVSVKKNYRLICGISLLYYTKMEKIFTFSNTKKTRSSSWETSKDILFNVWVKITNILSFFILRKRKNKIQNLKSFGNIGKTSIN